MKTNPPLLSNPSAEYRIVNGTPSSAPWISANYHGPGRMAFKSRFVGRMEKRLPIAIVVRLALAQDQHVNGAEVAYTDNVSAHGARVVSHRPWQTGEMIRVTSLQDENSISGKVVYCHKLPDERYLIGLNFQNGGVTWSKYRAYSGA